MDVYLDTEFTDLLNPDLISLGMVAANGETLYLEIDDTWTRADCSQFVRDVVLPLLGGGKHACGVAEADERTRAFLERVADEQGVTLFCDSQLDLVMLRKLWGEVGKPAVVTGAMVITLGMQQEMAREDAYEQGLRRHHALDDSIALMRGRQLVKAG